MRSFNHERGKSCLLNLQNLFHQLELSCFLVQGTALGAVRDHGFCKHEKDIDFGFLQEDFTPKVPQLVKELTRMGFDPIQQISRPFTKVRTIATDWNGIHVDLVGFIKWRNKRFVARPLDERNLPPYAIVHQAEMVEKYDQVLLFDHKFNVPLPTDKYLRFEYGPDWVKPKDDHFSRTRIYDYCEKEDIPYDLLD